MKKKYRLKKWVRVVFTLIIIIVGFVIYHILANKGAYACKSMVASMFICLGWFWLIMGQIIALYLMWEE